MILLCLSICYFGMSFISSQWPLVLALLLTVCCSVFVQAGAGSVFSFVPLIKKRITGQVSGMVGAFGNIGGVAFLTVLSFVSPSLFFQVIGIVALVCFVTAFFLKEPVLSEQREVNTSITRNMKVKSAARELDQV